VGSLGLVFDYSLLLRTNNQLQAALDASVLAAAQELPSEYFATGVCEDYFEQNMPEDNALYADVHLDISFPDSANIKATGAADVPYFFMSSLGFSDGTVRAAAQARVFDADLALIIDRSGSMCRDSYGVLTANCPDEGPWEPMDSVKEAAQSFAASVSEGVRMSLISYSTSATLDVPITGDRAAIVDGIERLVPGGYTDIGGGVGVAIQEILDSGLAGRPGVVVLLTDGQPNMIEGQYVGYGQEADDYVMEKAEEILDEGFMTFTIAFGNNADRALMRDIADLNDGKYYYAPGESQLNLVFQEIAETKFIRLVTPDAVSSH
jgi:secreted protein with Ig-like and vWFA domain